MLTANDKHICNNMCSNFIFKMEENEDWIQNVWFMDEVHFHLNGVVNHQNWRFLGSHPPEEMWNNHFIVRNALLSAL